MTPAQAMDIGSKLIQLLTQQRLLYRQLHQMARQQTDLVDGRDPETLLRVLAGRRRVLERLSTIDAQLQPIRDDWQRIARTLPDEQRREAQELVTSVQDILSDILAQDEKDSRKLSHTRQQVADQIRAAHTGKRMNQAYGRQQHPDAPRALDTNSE